MSWVEKIEKLTIGGRRYYSGLESDCVSFLTPPDSEAIHKKGKIPKKNSSPGYSAPSGLFNYLLD